MKAYLLKAIGRVQRVGYRRFVQELAQELKLSGHVVNEPDGTVTIFVQGDEDKLKAFLERVKSPPPPALVKELQVRDARPRSRLRYFEVKYGRLADELQEGFGAMQTAFNDYRNEFGGFHQEFRDFRQEFRDFRQEFREFHQEFQEFKDESLKLSHEALEEVRELRKDLRTILDERLARMEKDIAEVTSSPDLGQELPAFPSC